MTEQENKKNNNLYRLWQYNVKIYIPSQVSKCSDKEKYFKYIY